MCVIVDFKSINVNFYQILVHITVIFRNLIFVCITIKDKLIKHLYNSHSVTEITDCTRRSFRNGRYGFRWKAIDLKTRFGY